MLFVFVFLEMTGGGRGRGGLKRLPYPRRDQKNKVFLKTAFALVTAL